MSQREEEIRQRQATCDCPPDFHVCTAIAECKRLEEFDREKEAREKEAELEELRVDTLGQAKLIKSVSSKGMAAEFCDNVIRLLTKEDEDAG